MNNNNDQQEDIKKEKEGEEPENYDDLTVADMNVEGMPWYKDKKSQQRAKDLEDLQITKSEEKAIIKGAYQAFFPAFFIGLAVFCASFGIIMFFFWLASR